MKKYALPLALVATVTLQACNQQSAPEAADTAATVMLEDSNQRLSYGIAFGLGQRMAADGVPMDVDAFSAGLRDAMEGAEPRMTPEEIQAEMQAYQERAMAEQQAAIAAAGEANLAASEAFLTENAQRDGVVVTESGLQYEVITMGEGETPSAESTVNVHYEGTFIDGSVFDSSYERGEPISFPLNAVIPGWSEGLQLMPVGSKFKLYLPSNIGYGPRATGPIPGNSVLIFTVELLGIE